MAIEKVTYLYEALLRFDETGFKGAHQIHAEGFLDTETSEISNVRPLDAQPLAEADIVTLIGGENATFVARIAQLEAERNAALSEKTTAEAATQAAQALVSGKDAEIATLTSQLDALQNPPQPEFPPLSRAAFLFMADKLGLTEQDILALIAAMPETTEAEADAKKLAEYVFKNQQDFERDNQLLNNLIGLSPLTSEQVDTAWGAAAALTW